jgi:hypothetical protein
MNRVLIGFFVIVLACAARSDVPRARDPIPNATFAVEAEPVFLNDNDRRVTRLGALEWLGGWALSADHDNFGGISALDVDGPHFTALSDQGAVIRFTQAADGSFQNGSVAPLPRGCSRNRYKSDQDTESIARRAPGGPIWSGLEGRNMMCRFDSRLYRAEGEAQPSAMKDWKLASGPEAIVWLKDGRLAVFAEASVRGDPRVTPLLLFSGDPVDHATRVAERLYRAPSGFRPVDAARLPDGRVLVLNRRFAFPFQFTAKLVVIAPSEFDGSAIVSGKEVATFAPPIISDNLEALAVQTTTDATLIWIASDDNFQWPQRNLLLKFRWMD